MLFLYMYFKVWEFFDDFDDEGEFEWLPYQLRLSTQKEAHADGLLDESLFNGQMYFGWICKSILH